MNEILKNEWMRGPIASHLEVKLYMKALQKEMELCDQEHYGRQESANSNYIVNKTKGEEFQVQTKQNDFVNDVTAINDKVKGRVIHTDIENELNLDDDNDFDLGEDNDPFDQDIDDEQFLGYQDPEIKSNQFSKSSKINEDTTSPSNLKSKYEEIDTNICTVFPDKI